MSNHQHILERYQKVVDDEFVNRLTDLILDESETPLRERLEAVCLNESLTGPSALAVWIMEVEVTHNLAQRAGFRKIMDQYKITIDDLIRKPFYDEMTRKLRDWISANGKDITPPKEGQGMKFEVPSKETVDQVVEEYLKIMQPYFL